MSFDEEDDDGPVWTVDPFRESKPCTSDDDDDFLIMHESQIRRKLHVVSGKEEDASATQPERASHANGNASTAPGAQDVAAPPSAPARPTIQLPGLRPAFMMTEEQLAIGPLVLSPEHQVPAAINRFLREYQREGVRFFYRSYRQGRGCILGDDMGLGKTIQIIAFLAAIMHKGGTEQDEARRITAMREDHIPAGRQRANAVWETCLIVCPASVTSNWQNELDTWGFFEHALLTDEFYNDFARGRLDILISSHEAASRQIERLKDVHFSVFVVDECHKVKNPKSAMTQAFNSMPCQVRIGLSGTVVQNRYEEFYTILDWCASQKFCDAETWSATVENPIKWGQASNASEADIAGARIAAQRLADTVLPRWFLRRTKDIIKAQLPQKRDNIVFCPMTATQVKVYKMILAEQEVCEIRKANDPCQCGRMDEEGLPYKRRNCCFPDIGDYKRVGALILKYLQLLQKCANHVALVFPDRQDDLIVSEHSSQADKDKKARYDRQLAIVKRLFPKNWRSMEANARNGMNADFCGKWIILRDLLRMWKKAGDKLLLFSNNLRLLDWIGYFIDTEGFNRLRLDGKTPQKDRQPLVDRFNKDPSIFCFLISTTAGGAGLNLTGANRVVVLDPHWNPAHDMQAMDRAYRFGQTRDVDVYRLIGTGSLEENIYDRQVWKQQLGRIAYEASHERRYFEMGFESGLKELLSFHEHGDVTKEIIKQCDINEAAAAGLALAKTLKDEGATEAPDEKASVGTRVKKEADDDNAGTLPSNFSQPTAPLDLVQEILMHHKVRYTHRNDKLLGGSAAEHLISERAMSKHSARGKPRSRQSADASSDDEPSTSKRKRVMSEASTSSGRKKAKREAKDVDVKPQRQWPPPRRPPKVE